MSSRSTAGFTLMEILIVVIIIGILASLTAIGVNQAIVSSKMSHSESLIRVLEGALEVYQTRWGDYPPSTLKSFRGVKPPNDTNNGIEALVACLSSTKKGGTPVWQASTDELYLNTDEDEIGKNVTGWFFGDKQLREVGDYFGWVLTYVHHKDYEKPPKEILTYIFAVGEPPAAIQPAKSARTSTFARPMKFQHRRRRPDYERKNHRTHC
ncbi:MAG: prepilin-type N-terminal cleavage/methylation domain-containing protein [Planctomycetota bacterium]|jgi:prepilin-type N-terminal cleavage/methylation domain-containing protein